MAKKIELVQKAKLHNEFRIVLEDTRTGKIKYDAKAYNIILDEGLRRWVRQLTGTIGVIGGVSGSLYLRMMLPAVSASYESSSYRKDNCFGGAIYLGTGTGTLDRSRTTLFTPAAELRSAFFNDRYVDMEQGTAKYTQYAATAVGQLQGSVVTEVGLGPYDSTPSTHALIEDAEGKPLGVEIGEFDRLTAYAATFISVSSPYGSNVGMVGGGIGNILLRLVGDNVGLMYGTRDPAGSRMERPQLTFYVGCSTAPIDSTQSHILTTITTKGPLIGEGNLEDFKAVFNIPRFEPNQANNRVGIREIGASMNIHVASLANFGPYGTTPLFRSVMPVTGVFDGKDIEEEELGTGDGERTTFDLKWADIVENSDKIYVADRTPELQVRDTDYTFNNALVPFGVAIGANFERLELVGCAYEGGYSGESPIEAVADGNSETWTVIRIASRSGTTYTSSPRLIFKYTRKSETDKLRIYQGVNSLRGFEFQGSNDLQHWTTLVDDELPNQAGWQEFSFEQASYKHWSVLLKTGWASSDTIILREFEWKQSQHQIEFVVPPEMGAAVTGGYTVPYIPKDSDRVLDISFAIQFSDKNAEEEEE